MHTMTSTGHWHPANDNEKAPVEPPSITPVTAMTILIANTDSGVELIKDAAPAYPVGDFLSVGTTREPEPRHNFYACQCADRRVQSVATGFSTDLIIRDADQPVCTPANDQF